MPERVAARSTRPHGKAMRVNGVNSGMLDDTSEPLYPFRYSPKMVLLLHF